MAGDPSLEELMGQLGRQKSQPATPAKAAVPKHPFYLKKETKDLKVDVALDGNNLFYSNIWDSEKADAKLWQVIVRDGLIVAREIDQTTGQLKNDSYRIYQHDGTHFTHINYATEGNFHQAMRNAYHAKQQQFNAEEWRRSWIPPTEIKNAACKLATIDHRHFPDPVLFLADPKGATLPLSSRLDALHPETEALLDQLQSVSAADHQKLHDLLTKHLALPSPQAVRNIQDIIDHGATTNTAKFGELFEGHQFLINLFNGLLRPEANRQIALVLDEKGNIPYNTKVAAMELLSRPFTEEKLVKFLTTHTTLASYDPADFKANVTDQMMLHNDRHQGLEEHLRNVSGAIANIDPPFEDGLLTTLPTAQIAGVAIAHPERTWELPADLARLSFPEKERLSKQLAKFEAEQVNIVAALTAFQALKNATDRLPDAITTDQIKLHVAMLERYIKATLCTLPNEFDYTETLRQINEEITAIDHLRPALRQTHPQATVSKMAQKSGEPFEKFLTTLDPLVNDKLFSTLKKLIRQEKDRPEFRPPHERKQSILNEFFKWSKQCADALLRKEAQIQDALSLFKRDFLGTAAVRAEDYTKERESLQKDYDDLQKLIELLTQAYALATKYEVTIPPNYHDNMKKLLDLRDQLKIAIKYAPSPDNLKQEFRIYSQDKENKSTTYNKTTKTFEDLAQQDTTRNFAEKTEITYDIKKKTGMAVIKEGHFHHMKDSISPSIKELVDNLGKDRTFTIHHRDPELLVEAINQLDNLKVDLKNIYIDTQKGIINIKEYMTTLAPENLKLLNPPIANAEKENQALEMRRTNSSLPSFGPIGRR